jgi:predicted metal-dependent phosphoesterase TrpH
MCQQSVLSRWCRECYTPPEEAYERLKQRGMDLVTVTDHDSIGAAETLSRHADFFLSEEVSCRMPSGTEIHMGVYDITEQQHVELARRREDFFSLLAYLNEQRLFFSINHVFSHLTGRREQEDFELFEAHFPAIETRNGQILPKNNQHAARLARKWRKAQVAGSDAHILEFAGTTFTEVPGARDKAEYFAGLRAGWGRPAGDTGDYWKLTRAVLQIGFEMMSEKRWTLLLAPLAAMVPICILANYFMEVEFAQRWRHRVSPLCAGRHAIPSWRAKPVSDGVTL